MEMPHPCTANDPSVDALKAGSEHAFRCLFEQERERLRRFVLKLIDDADEAENIVQETFTEAYQQIEDFRGESSVSTWLFSIAKHLAYGHLRTSDRHNYLEHETIEFLQADQGGSAAATRKEVELSERKQIVHDALQELPEHYRRVVQLRDLEEKSTRETAEQLELTEVNVRVRLHRARKQLREHLCERMEC
ncbi:MAG: RNA polymerase subunit sigma-70 [Bacteroidetes bacterium SW_8_64_56]|jgi:RNA polymerase sigma-70 factor (ECF subfamily)|nr:MAG: RNA polymerase subunit sigma-70 [Bacteroidetes bacterium QH_6_64_77]PSQ99414.1 MAG: RNA polymerase subunit sigma-70 [Bacteroidetes bacterium SW_7_64_58]PSR01223.1 MAG: RNA polymerase subunit sigma-70 [Bacteroidetes bacterium SW_8_64_56]